MWYIFPQLKGLGRSPAAWRYGVASLEEARAYLRHPVLGDRLRECTRLVLAVQGRTAAEIFGWPDDVKLKSCMTLFALAESGGGVFAECLEKYFDGERDAATERALTSE
ncbi:unnamed protein product [Prorocentrum cordatum]|uniref:DUF1810 domain-containing protein n=1 Tax=Prorocentrum cordatum TaxID=2364126 RepID=A0ABN9UDQ5_9DINO|nr:unnamed protein product [Polarella glacialis]